MKRREVLKGMAASSVGLGTLSLPGHAVPSEMPVKMTNMCTDDKNKTKLVLLHTNDLHGHLESWLGWEGPLRDRQIGGFACLSTGIRSIRQEESERILLLDAGDLIGDTMLADFTQGACMIAALNCLNCDAMTFGNHEPDFGEDVLRQRVAQAKFLCLAANLKYKATGELFTLPYSIRDVADLRVGILGLTYPKTPRTTAKLNINELDYTDPIEAAELYVPKMRSEGAEIVVVLSHLGLIGDVRLAQSVDGIDVIVGGHSHNRMDSAQQVKETLIVQAGAFGSDLGRLDLEIVNGRIESYKRKLIVLDHDVLTPDPAAEVWLKEQIAPYRKQMDEVVGNASSWLIRAQALAGQRARKRDEESPVDSLFADLLREAFEADVAFLPGVGYGIAIPPGEMSAAQLRQLIPHDGKVVTLSLSGLQVREVLEQSLDNIFSENPAINVGGMIQISGIRFRYVADAAKGARVVELQKLDGTWNDSDRLKIVTNSMLSNGGHNQETFRHGIDRKEHKSQYEHIKELIRSKAAVQTPALGRISAR